MIVNIRAEGKKEKLQKRLQEKKQPVELQNLQTISIE